MSQQTQKTKHPVVQYIVIAMIGAILSGTAVRNTTVLDELLDRVARLEILIDLEKRVSLLEQEIEDARNR